ncbi:MAG TPA: mechanosensitive ion channel domain-containing protein [Pirellulaceae bacterium]|jgi:potassium efflux system protein|nr:mechanosensitive ion channel domain-containing protein [Pirellulaceae bacterium]
MRGRIIANVVSCAFVGCLLTIATALRGQPLQPLYPPPGAQEPTGSAAIGSVNPLRAEAATLPPTGIPANGGMPANGGAPANGSSGAAPATGAQPAAPAGEGADDLAAPAVRAIPTLTPLDVQRRREEVSKLEGLDAALKTRADEVFAQAAKDVEAASQDAGLASSYDQEVATVATRRAALEKESQNLSTAPAAPPVPPDASQGSLEALLEKAKQDLAASNAKLAELQAEPTRRATRRTEIPKEQAEASAKLEQARAKFEAYTGEGEAPEVASAQRMALQAQVQRLEAVSSRLGRETAYYSATADLLPLQQDVALKRSANAEKQVKSLSELLTQRMHKEVRELADKAQENSQTLPEELQPIVERLQARADRSAELVNRIDAIRALQDEIEANTEQWRRDFQRVKEKLGLVGMSQGMGILLKQKRQRMDAETSQFVQAAHDEPDAIEAIIKATVPANGADGNGSNAAVVGNLGPEVLDDSSDILRNLSQSILDARLELMNLEDERSAFRDPRVRAAELVDRIHHARQGGLPMPEEALLAKTEELLIQDRDQLNLLIKYQANYFEELIDLDTLERSNQQLLAEYRAFIDERILWTPSATPGTLLDSRGYLSAVAWLADPDEWRTAYDLWIGAVYEGPWLEIIFLVTFLPFLLYQRRLRRYLAKWAEVAARPTCQAIRPTLLAVLVTGLLALPWAWLPLFASIRLMTLPLQSELTFSLGRAFLALAWWSFYVQFLRHLLRTKGLADAHFFWSGPSRKRLRSYVLAFYPMTAPLVFLIVVLHVKNEEAIQNGPARALAIALLAILAVNAYLIFRPSGPWANRSPAVAGGIWEYRMRWLIWAVTTLSPVALAILSIVGYHYTAMRLSSGFIQTSILFTALLLLRATIARWMLLHRRRLAFQQARARLQNAGGDGETESRTLDQLGVPPAERQTLDLNQLSEQGRRLVSLLIGLAACAGLVVIWQDVLPAFNLLDRAVLIEDESGVAARDITLLSIALAIAAILLTTAATRNVPGLLELFLLPRLPLDAGARYAVTTIARYLILLVGIVSTARFVGIEWSQYQWLVGAAAVGLGFGLQEIFANFVSGLILLFERPVRVGDVVTVEGVTGVVSKIRMRATTVVNWDNQEYIVPNKDFVTGKLLNWTLTNSRNRITITVGISYDDDPDVARQVLLEAAREMDFVMKDPGPSATMEGFDDSSLRLVLRCHLESLEHRMDTTHELHAAINRKFRAAKLSIPFPQRDINFRTPMTLHSNGNGHSNGQAGDGSAASAPRERSETPA